ncbi:glycerate kinase [Lactobacillus selangorensis]|uniref:Glycerate kinase n=1 Tax=Lactobacillus selangorensis TaxID=81857 RepID=A0A0R2FWG3_9LACO|nr:glycerate kinase [Lactobacillus selangorensis]KRN28885.1 glycerate kinase [Lactobacillus selangorensis]KRN32705.1 glycerate kinase [Lactobacillus selangorensis]
MKIVIASDKYKGSATSAQVAQYIQTGIQHVASDAQTTCVAIADGGDGTVAGLVNALQGQVCEQTVQGPLGTPTQAAWGLLPDDQAVIEMAAAAGFVLTPEKRPLQASTYGVGQLILAALEAGVRSLYVGLGGSATNDGGMGMAIALGARFWDAAGHELTGCAAHLGQVARVDVSQLDPRLQEVHIVGLADVDNSLLGAQGATAVFGPQKGLAPAQISSVDADMRHYSQCVAAAIGRDDAQKPGAGAAGGLGFGLLAFAHAQIQSGIETYLKLIHFQQQLAGADLIITGEGRMDGQTAAGKAPLGVAHAAQQAGLPVVAVVGSASADVGSVYQQGIDLVISAVTEPMPLQTALAHTQANITRAGATAMRAFLLGQKQASKGLQSLK